MLVAGSLQVKAGGRALGEVRKGAKELILVVT